MSRLSSQMNKALNDEIGLEFFAYVQYMAMGAYFEKRSLDKLAAFFYNQADEEKMHGEMILKYVVEVDGVVDIPSIQAPQCDFASAQEVAQLFVDQEAHVTEQFYKMVDLAQSDKDYMTHKFLQWFVDEQREEMATSNKLLDLIKMAGENQLLMVEMMVDNLEAAGTTEPPAPE